MDFHAYLYILALHLIYITSSRMAYMYTMTWLSWLTYEVTTAVHIVCLLLANSGLRNMQCIVHHVVLIDTYMVVYMVAYN